MVQKDLKTLVTEEIYTPNSAIIRNLTKRLELYESLNKKAKAGEKPSRKDKRALEYLNRRKPFLLKSIFKSMANVVTFLEWCSASPILAEAFEHDIEELLLGANHNEKLGKSKKNRWLKVEQWNQPILIRFLHAALYWNVAQDKDNFRLKIFPILIHVIDHFIWTTAQTLLSSEDDPTLTKPAGTIANEKFHEVMNNELARLSTFIDLLAKDAKMERAKNPHRPVQF